MNNRNEINRLHARYAYIDTSCFEDENFEWEGRSISRLSTLIDAGEITLLMTDVTRYEINRRLGKALDKIESELRNVKSGIMKVLRRHSVNPISSSSTIKDELIKEFGEFVERRGFLHIPLTRDVDTIVFQYFNGDPPFSKAKPNEFKDAIVIQSIREWATIQSQKVYFVASDGDWESCCTDASPFIYRNSVDALVSDARNLTRGGEELKKSLVRNNHFMNKLFDLIRALPLDIRLPISLERKSEEIEIGEVKLVDVRWWPHNYFGLEIVGIDSASNSLLCTVRLETRLTFEASENICEFLYGGEHFGTLLRKSHKSGSYHLFSEVMFRAETKVSGFKIGMSGQVHVDDIQMITSLISTGLHHR